jgi:hypothetical protein
MPDYPTKAQDIKDGQPAVANNLEFAFNAFVNALTEAAEHDLKVSYKINANTLNLVGGQIKTTSYYGDIQIFAKVN